MNPTHAPLILDIAGTQLEDIDRRRLKHPLTGGLILFARNWQDRAQLTALCADIKQTRPDLLILVDHEGGRVQRFRTDGFTHLPPMRALGEMWLQDDKGQPGSGALKATRSIFPAAASLSVSFTCCPLSPIRRTPNTVSVSLRRIGCGLPFPNGSSVSKYPISSSVTS